MVAVARSRNSRANDSGGVQRVRSGVSQHKKFQNDLSPSDGIGTILGTLRRRFVSMDCKCAARRGRFYDRLSLGGHFLEFSVKETPSPFWFSKLSEMVAPPSYSFCYSP